MTGCCDAYVTELTFHVILRRTMSRRLNGAIWIPIALWLDMCQFKSERSPEIM